MTRIEAGVDGAVGAAVALVVGGSVGASVGGSVAKVVGMAVVGAAVVGTVVATTVVGGAVVAAGGAGTMTTPRTGTLVAGGLDFEPCAIAASPPTAARAATTPNPTFRPVVMPDRGGVPAGWTSASVGAGGGPPGLISCFFMTQPFLHDHSQPGMPVEVERRPDECHTYVHREHQAADRCLSHWR